MRDEAKRVRLSDNGEESSCEEANFSLEVSVDICKGICEESQ